MDGPTKVAIGCQGGGMHAAFGVGVLTEILKDIRDKNKIELVGLSGTSAGALCALMVWYGLAPKKNGRAGSVDDAIESLNDFWEDFVASTGTETALNLLTYGAYWVEEKEIPILGVNVPILGLNPYGALYRVIAASLPNLGVRQQYFDLEEMLAKACPDFARIDWSGVNTRVVIGASEVVNGFETVFDSDVNRKLQQENKGMQPVNKPKDKDSARYWRQRLPLTLSGAAASGTLPALREAEDIKDDGCYWDGLYSQNPPVRDFFEPPVNKRDTKPTHVPDELWIVRINPQQWPEVPKSNRDIQDRQNELMGNLSLNKELDFIMTVNAWNERYKDEKFGTDHKDVTVRTIKMDKTVADNLSYSSKFNRSRAFMDELRKQGREVARGWLARWHDGKAGSYPEDAAYPESR